VIQAFDRGDVWEIGGYHIVGADGVFKSEERNRRDFWCLHDFVTTTSGFLKMGDPQFTMVCFITKSWSNDLDDLEVPFGGHLQF